MEELIIFAKDRKAKKIVWEENSQDGWIGFADFYAQSMDLANFRPLCAKPKKIFLPLTVSVPKQYCICPSHTDVIGSFDMISTQASIYDISGFNYSAEFADVYKGKSGKGNAYKDTLALCKRALQNTRNELSEEELSKYSAFALQKCLWESIIAIEMCMNTFQTAVSRKIEMNITIPKLQHLKIFFGQANEELCVWLRVCIPVEQIKQKHNGGIVDIAFENLTRGTSQFICYRRFTLNKTSLAELSGHRDSAVLISGAPASAPPAPPPRPPSENEVAVLLELSQLPLNSKVPASVYAAMAAVEDEDAAEADNLLYYQSHMTDKVVKPAVAVNQSLESTQVRSQLGLGSSCCELVGWGHNSSHSLGLDKEELYEPRLVPLPASLLLERVLMIACSPRHTLLLTAMHNIFGCGENSEGALGVGDLQPRSVMTLMTWPVDSSSSASAPVIVKIAAGSGTLGSHSVALDDQGRLYAWGLAYATGLGGTKAALTPTQVTKFPNIAGTPPTKRRRDNDDEEQEYSEAQTDGDDDFDMNNTGVSSRSVLFKVSPCVDVACGGCFTVAVMKSGRVCSWGVWAHGRLGQGFTPQIVSTGRKRSGGTKLARYKMTPGVVEGVTHAVSVSCGEAHALCLLDNGAVLSWGHNSCGQLGVGPNKSGYLKDSTRPMLVPPFCAIDVGNALPVRVQSVHAGSYHSVAIDMSGKVWSWGGRGSPCLGHNDSPGLEGPWTHRMNSLMSVAATSEQVMIPYELQEWCKRWSLPRRIEQISQDKDEIQIVQVALGDMHTALLSSNNQLFMCGAGPVVPPFVPIASHDSDDDDEEEEDENTDSTQPAGSDATQDKELQRLRERSSHTKLRMSKKKAAKFSIVAIPRRPSASWFGSICTRKCVMIASSGTRLFSLLDEESISQSLTSPMLHKLFHANKIVNPNMNLDVSYLKSVLPQEPEAVDDASYGSAGLTGSYFVTRGRADCMILASGKILVAHRAILAQRSSELREMISMETPADDTAFDQAIQLLLPELHQDTAKVLLIFLYTDVVPAFCVGNKSLLLGLSRAAVALKLPRLQVTCEQLLNNLAIAEQELLSGNLYSASANLQSKLHAITNMEMPPSTLARDMGSLVGDPQFADVRFVAEGKAIYAHRFVLESRCEYFRLMFQSGMMESYANNHHHGGGSGSSSSSVSSSSRYGRDRRSAVIDVVVPDTFVGFLRLLLFVYTDTLPDGSDEALLEDLMSADRYRMSDMKVLCESMLVPSKHNWMSILHAADMLDSTTLRDQAACFLRDNFSVLMTSSPSDLMISDPPMTTAKQLIQDIQQNYPGFFDEVLEKRKIAFPVPPSATIIEQAIESSKKSELAAQTKPFPLWAMGALIIVLYVYQFASTIVTLGPIIPVVNCGVIIGLLIFAYYKLANA